MVPDLSLLVALMLGLWALADPSSAASVAPLRALAGTGAVTLAVV